MCTWIGATPQPHLSPSAPPPTTSLLGEFARPATCSSLNAGSENTRGSFWMLNLLQAAAGRCVRTGPPLQHPVTAACPSRCNRDNQTIVGVNGDKQVARFSFEAFRFIHSTDATFSTYYVHCATRLCVNNFCTGLNQVLMQRARTHARTHTHTEHFVLSIDFL